VAASALESIVGCIDLTSLSGSETPEDIERLCAKAARPDPADPSIPSAAAVCIYPRLIPAAVGYLRGTGLRVAAVAGGFPTGAGSLDARVAEIGEAVASGADEVDAVLNRPAFLAGRYRQVLEEVAASKVACGDARLKVILETGSLRSFDRIRRAALLAMAGGADFVKTSTGKVGAGVTLPAALCMMEAVRDFLHQTGKRVGVKVSGGIRSTRQAEKFVAILEETLGPEWMTPDLFRIGASGLLEDVVREIHRQRAGVRGSNRPPQAPPRA
jgi:deoxyribose-phosphate aldolase